jgi:hypothetical protein
MSEDNLSSENHLNKSSDNSLLFSQWFLNNSLWDRWNEKLKNYYKKECLEIAKQYSVESWIRNFTEIILDN